MAPVLIVDSERERRLIREAAENLAAALDIPENRRHYLEGFIEKLVDVIAFRQDTHVHAEKKLEQIIQKIREMGRVRIDRAADFIVEQGIYTSEYRARNAVRYLVKTHRLIVEDGLYLRVNEKHRSSSEEVDKYIQQHLF